MATKRVPTLGNDDKLAKAFLPALAPTDVGAEPAGAVATHASHTTAVHGIADTALLETTTGSQTKATAAQTAAATDATTKAAAAQAAAIAAAATDATTKANAAQAAAVQRSAHTGTQPIGTVTNLQATLDAKADLVGGVLPSAQLPNGSITNPVPAVSQAAMLALTAQPGDIAIRTDFSPPHFFFLGASPATTLGNWTDLGAGQVTSINGQIGVVVLSAANVGAVPTARTITVAAPLTGGGDLTANRTIGITVGTTAGTVAAGNDPRFAGIGGGGGGDMLAANNLAEVANAATSRTNLGLGNAAIRNVGATNATVAAGDAPAVAQAFAIQRGNHTGTQSADTLTDGTTNKAFLATERTKLAGVATGATVNATDAQLRDRSTHTGSQAEATITGLSTRLAAMDADIAAASGGSSTLVVTVTANGTTDAAPTIQAVLDNLGTSSKSYRIMVQPSAKGSPIYINSQVRITTSQTQVSFAGPVLIGPLADPEGFGCFSILGTTPGGNTTVTSGATRGSSKIVVASASGYAAKTLIKIADTDNSGGGQAGDKAEMAQVIHVVGTTLYLDHPLYHTFTGTINVTRVVPVVGSGFDGVNATFAGQQAHNVFRFIGKMQYTQLCYFRNMHFRGDLTNSWSRECVNLRWSYRSVVENCSTSVGWDYQVGSTFDYGFSSDGSTECAWRNCHASNTRHGFSADKGSAGLIYSSCWSDNTTASAFDLHGGWVTDVVYANCEATASDTLNSNDGTKVGFLAGNTSFINGSHWITYIGCTARGFGPYTSNLGASGESAGFEVVDGCTNVSILSCRIDDCQYGLWVLSLVGAPGSTIRNVIVKDTVFNGIANTSGDAFPIWVNAGVAPNDVDGLVIKGNAFVNCAGQSSAQIYGQAGNTLANIVIEDNLWDGPGVAGVYALDVRYVDDPLITRNTFFKTRRGIRVSNSPGAAVVLNTFDKLVDGATASNVVLDGGGNTGLVVADNPIVGTAITVAGTAPSSSGASVVLMPAQRAYATAGRPPAAAVGAGASYFDTTLGKPAWSTGSVWKDAAGTTV